MNIKVSPIGTNDLKRKLVRAEDCLDYFLKSCTFALQFPSLQ